MLDAILAILHHLLAFGLFAIIAAELVIISPGLDAQRLRRAGIIDLHYGLMAVLMLLVGFTRAIYAAKGWSYYAHNAFFWAKLGTFALIGLLSILPTLRILRWRRALRQDPQAPPAAAEITRVRRVLWLELALAVLLPIFAALMARGYGEW